MSEYPEHDRLAAVADESQRIGEFLEWLTLSGIVLASWVPGLIEHRLAPIPDSTEQILARYFDIDLKRLADEKHAMYLRLSAMARQHE